MEKVELGLGNVSILELDAFLDFEYHAIFIW